MLRDRVLGKRPELFYKQNMKCGAIEASAVLTRHGLYPVSTGESLFVPSCQEGALEELHVSFNATAAFSRRLHWSGKVDPVLAVSSALASQWTVP